MLGLLDEKMFYFINKNLINPVFDFLMPILTNFGSGHLIFAVAIFIMVFARKEKKVCGVYLLAGLTVSYYLVDVILKDLLAMPRPFMSISDVRVLVDMPHSFSTPSGHATNAFMLSMILYKFFGKSILWFIPAFLVAFSRVYVGVHYMSDTIFGALVGIFIAYFLMKPLSIPTKIRYM